MDLVKSLNMGLIDEDCYSKILLSWHDNKSTWALQFYISIVDIDEISWSVQLIRHTKMSLFFVSIFLACAISN